MTLPDGARIQLAVAATWPPAKQWTEGAFTFRDGAGGGKRVSAATATGGVTTDGVRHALRTFRDVGEAPLFCVRSGEDRLDALLDAEGLGVVDPTVLYAVAADHVVDPSLHRLAAISCETPLAIQREIWAQGGVGPARVAVMARAPGKKSYLLGRAGDRPAGAAFIACDGPVAMIHAIEVDPAHRRKGVATALLRKAGQWAVQNDATVLGLAVTRANEGARALYASLGMKEVGRYQYRIGTREETA